MTDPVSQHASRIQAQIASNSNLIQNRQNPPENIQAAVSSTNQVAPRGSFRWTFTIHNPTDDRIKQLQTFLTTKCSFGHYQAEICPTTNRVHLQGFFILASKSYAKLDFIKKSVIYDGHYEIMQGTPEQNLDYCSKEQTRFSEIPPFTHGSLGQPFFKQQKITLEAAIAECPTVQEFRSKHVRLYCHYKNGISDIYASRKAAEQRIPPLVCWFYGETGSGKTSSAYFLCEKYQLSYWLSNQSLQWFDHYQGEDVVIIDDFRKQAIDFPTLLKILDRYKIQLQTKGGHVAFNPKVIIITNPWHYNEHFSYKDEFGNVKQREDIGQLARRIHHVHHFQQSFKPNLAHIVQYVRHGYKEALDRTAKMIAEFNLGDPLHQEIQQPILSEDQHFYPEEQYSTQLLTATPTFQAPAPPQAQRLNSSAADKVDSETTLPLPMPPAPANSPQSTHQPHINHHSWVFSEESSELPAATLKTAIPKLVKPRTDDPDVISISSDSQQYDYHEPSDNNPPSHDPIVKEEESWRPANFEDEILSISSETDPSIYSFE